MSFSTWMDKQLWYVNAMEYYSMIKINELLGHKKMWKNYKGILLSERSQSENATYCMTLTIRHSGKGKTMETVKRSVVARGYGEGGGKNRWSRGDF